MPDQVMMITSAKLSGAPSWMGFLRPASQTMVNQMRRTVSEEACGTGGVGGGDDATCLQADEAEGDTGHEQLNNLPEGGGGEAFFRFECRHVFGAGELDSADDHGNNAGGMHAFSSEVGAKGDHEGHGVTGDHVVGALANVAAEPAEDVTNNDREDRAEHEVLGDGERLDVVAAGH